MTYPSDPHGSWQDARSGWQGQQPGWPAEPQPDNYLVWAILTKLFCFFPTGIVSIVHSSKVSALWMQGQYGEAQAAARKAKKWAIVSAIVWAVLTVGTILFVIVMVVIGINLHGVTPPPTPTPY